MKINAIQCPKCKDIIYSRARHDFRPCTCGDIYVDGGFDYQRVGFKSKPPINVVMNIRVSKKRLAQDYYGGINKFGLIRVKK